VIDPFCQLVTCKSKIMFSSVFDLTQAQNEVDFV
jgi:hypothetical protein